MAEQNEAPAAEAAAPAEGDAAATPEAAGKGKKKKLIMFASIGVAVLGLAVAGGMFLFGGKSHEASTPDKQVADLAFFDVPEFNLNLLSDDPNTQHFVKTKISVELTKASDAASLEKLQPRLQDDWGGFLRQMRASDLQGSANLQRLKEGLLRRANQSLAPLQVKAVYIRELLVQ
jgi:flagellar FliL protein